MDLLDRPGLRNLAQVAIVPAGPGFEIRVDQHTVLTIRDELDAHHWAKHVVECVNSGVREPGAIRAALPRLCDLATRHNLHTGSWPCT